MVPSREVTCVKLGGMIEASGEEDRGLRAEGEIRFVGTYEVTDVVPRGIRPRHSFGCGKGDAKAS